jgi:PAS domain S-box-containing protein
MRSVEFDRSHFCARKKSRLRIDRHPQFGVELGNRVPQMKREWQIKPTRSVEQCLFGVIGLALLTFACFRFELNFATTGFAYLILIAVLSLMGTLIGPLFLSVVAVGLLNYFFAISLRVQYPQEILALVAFVTTSVIISSITVKARKGADDARAAQQALVDTIPALVWSALPDGSRDFHSRRWLEFTGLSAEEARSLDWAATVHPEDQAVVMDKWRLAVATGEPFEVKLRGRSAKGDYRSFLVRAAPLRDGKGDIIKWYGSNTDVEDRERALEALRRSEAGWKEVFEHNPLMYFMVDSTGIVLSVNAFGAAQLGYQVDELVGQSVLKVFLGEDRDFVLRCVAVCLENPDQSNSWEVRKVRKDGRVLWVRENAKAVRRADDQLIVLVACEDITEKNEASIELARFESIVASSDDAIISKDLDDRITSWNAGATRIFGYHSHEMVGQPITRIIPSELYAEENEILQRLQRGERIRTYETVRVAKGGGRIDMAVTTSTLFDKSGEVIGASEVGRDITERKKVEGALRLSAAYMAHAQQLASVGSWAYRKSCQDSEYWDVPDHWSPELWRITGFDRTQGYPSTTELISRTHPDDLQRMVEANRQVSEAGRPLNIQYRFLRADGEFRVLHSIGAVVHDKGEAARFVGATQDVTEQEKRTEDLKRSEAYLAEAQRLSNTGSFGWNIATGDIFWSEETFRIFEYDRANKPTWDLVLQRTHPEDRARVQQFLKNAMDESRDMDFEHRLLMPGGSVKDVRAVAHTVKDASGKIVDFLGAVMDITSTRRAERAEGALRQLESDFAHMNRVSMMGELAASLSHEIAQPIASARNNARAAQNFMDVPPSNLDEIREALSCVIGDVDRAGEIIDRIRRHMKKAPPRKERFDLNAAINEVIALARSVINRNGVSVHTSLADGLFPVWGDRVQLQQVVLNLILNAVEAMGSLDAGPRELLISTGQGYQGVLVAVHDSGPGIDSTHLEHVFEAFYTTKPSGMGMGLSVCRSIIASHGGRLWAEAREPRGAVFQFTLPGAQVIS